MALEDLLNHVHTVVVVGGKNSNNTRQLVRRCRDRGAVAYHVQAASELLPQWFDSVEAVGLTAGTSTLPETIEDVYNTLSAISGASAPAVHTRPWTYYPRNINMHGQNDAA